MVFVVLSNGNRRTVGSKELGKLKIDPYVCFLVPRFAPKRIDSILPVLEST